MSTDGCIVLILHEDLGDSINVDHNAELKHPSIHFV